MVIRHKDKAETSDSTSLGARLAALVVILAAAAVLGFYHRNDIFPPSKPVETGLNPEFVKCRDERTAQVAKMRSDGLIDDSKVATFTERAVSYCASTFPPDAAPSDPVTTN